MSVSNAHAVIIQNTASFSYTNSPTTAITASVDVTAATASSASIVAGLTPDIVPSGGSTTVSFDISNTGTGGINNGILIITPPTGTTTTISNLPGQYTTVVLANGDIQVTLLNPIAMNGTISITGTINVPTNTPSGTLVINADFSSNGVSIIAGTTPLTIQNTSTPSTIVFKQPDTSGNLVPAGVYHAGELVYVEITDGDQNKDPYTIETITAILTDNMTGDTETLTFTETGLDTGIFLASVLSTTALATANDGNISVAQGSQLMATYTDPFNNTDVSAAAVLVDPFGVLFDTSNGNPIDGIQITMIDTATGLPAAVFGDDGVSTYPATLITGGTATDSSGTVYNLAPGSYRYPFVSPGNYLFVLGPTTGFTHPSTVPTASLQTLTGAPFSIVNGSRGEVFVVNPGPALHIDIPLDPGTVSLFLRKDASKQTAAMGDFVQYRLTLENASALANATGVFIQDSLPEHFRYQADSAQLDGVPIANPTISADGRTLQFNIGTVAAGTSQILSYVTAVGARVQLGQAINSAFATATQQATAIVSNTAEATVQITDDLMGSKAFLMGRVFIDQYADVDHPTKHSNGFNDAGEQGVASVRIYLEDGTFTITDKDGFYHFEGLEPGRHVVQLDVDSLSNRYQVVGLENNRFAGSDMSQFVDLTGGALWRSNFRVVQRALASMPVTVSQYLKQENGQLWVSMNVEHEKAVTLSSLMAVYNLPSGWHLVENSALLNDKNSIPKQSEHELSWKLDPKKYKHHIRFAMQGGGDSGEKQAIASARFVSTGSPQGQTDLAAIDIEDKLSKQQDIQDHTLHLNFATAKAILPQKELSELKALTQQLQDMPIQSLTVEGHTDNIRIAPNRRHVFADNQALSIARAQFVAAYLAQHLKLEKTQVFVVGKGAHEAIASNDSNAGRAQNRRVVLRVKTQQHDSQLDTLLKNNHSQAAGEAKSQWDDVDEQKIKKVAANVTSDSAFVSLKDHSSLPHQIGSIQIVFDSRLKPILTLDGNEISSDNIGFKQKDTKTGKTTYTYIGIDFGKTGSHKLHLLAKDPFGNTRLDEKITLIRTGEIADIRLREKTENVADGISPIRLRIQLKDHTGANITSSVNLEYRGGDLTLPITKNNLKVQTTAEQSRVFVDTDGWITLAPTTKSGVHHVILGYNNVQRDIEVFVKPAYRDWILIGLGEGTLGYNQLNGAIQPIHNKADKDGFYQDGKLSFYAKGRVKGDYLLTMAYDTSKTKTQVGNALHQTIDPNRFYTVYGDGSKQQYDASSQRKLYIKVEKEAFYALFGDFNTGLSVTELSRYSRQLNGLKSEYRGDTFGYTAFATQTSKTLAKDELRGDGTSGLYSLSRQNITINTERITIETRDRFKSEIILESRQLMRHLDYDIDYTAGTLYFKQPVSNKDLNLNPVYIRVEYESDDQADQLTTFGARASVKPLKSLEIGATYVQQGKLGKDDQLTGIDAKLALGEQTEFIAEAAQSNTQIAKSNAYKAEIKHIGKQLSSRAYFRQVDDSFGLGQITGSENATRKIGADAEFRMSTQTKLLAEAYRQDFLSTNASRDSANVQVIHKIQQTSLRAGLRSNKDTDGAGNKVASNLLNVGATSKVADKLSIRLDREQNMNTSQSADFPTRTLLGADYQITANTTLSATQEWAQGALQSSDATRFGIRTQPWAGAQFSSSYEQQLAENGTRSFANFGLQQQWQTSDTMSFTIGMDRSHTIQHPGATGLNINAPLSTGGEDFTAVSLGMNYKPETWHLTNRIEYRKAATQRKWSVTSGIMGDPVQDLATMLNLQLFRDEQFAINTITNANLSLGLAYRPEYDGIVLLNRFDIRYSAQQATLSNSTDWRYINNLALNWQVASNLQVALNYGGKWVRETIDQNQYSGFTDLIGLRATYDINKLWDASVQAGMLHTWKTGQSTPSAGMSVGYNMMNNAWVGVGYNFTGFNDPDFTASEFTKQGPFVQIRFKFDQNSLAGMLGSED